MKYEDIINIFNSFNSDIVLVKNLAELKNINASYIGKQGKINKKFTELSNIPLSEKINHIKELNLLKDDILKIINLKKIELEKADTHFFLDMTMPIKCNELGSYHIISQTLYKIDLFFSRLGFIIKKGLEIDTTYYNFDALNMPFDHPSRDKKDTFYIDDSLLLRTHTSNMQIHIMKKKKPPINILSYGKVYRRDYDVSHTPMFHQIEGFMVGANISLANLKFVLLNFLNFFFGKSVDIKFRSSYFPFTDPSFEVDIKCVHCLGVGCNVCKNTGWIEILGCGIIHPFILNECKIKADIYKGFAFGIGVERLIMIKYKINDIKLFFENNIEFLKQF